MPGKAEESKRLLYVSLTRARDLLVIPLPEKKTTGEWMGLLQAEWMLPQGKKLKLPDGKEIPSEFWELDALTAEENEKDRGPIDPSGSARVKSPLKSCRRFRTLLLLNHGRKLEWENMFPSERS